MPRANRYFIPGYAWHITHRCHKKEFLLKFGRDRRSWIMWLFEAKKRYGLRVLNYMATSNHVHLLVLDSAEGHIIPKSMQLISGRTAQEFNQRKKRKGAFWEDRYHAAAIETGHHLISCLTYIDLNMVRAGAVAHPSDWPTCGYSEIRKPRERYSIIDHQLLMDLLWIPSIEALQRAHRAWTEHALATAEHVRESKWTESIAVGSRQFVDTIKSKLGVRAKGSRLSGTDDEARLRYPKATS
ncbi:MAG TPA: transposase [Syntrophobacteraceae bacterium]|nr:transposase [Syntrophobacteraceae bacterium]